MNNPYLNLDKNSYWSKGVVLSNPFFMDNIYNKKFEIRAEDKIATAGSCFAQHIAKGLVKNGYQVLDVEPPPDWLSKQAQFQHGFGLYSARYGNIYTSAQLLQLIKEVLGVKPPGNYIWTMNNRYFDAFRPAIEPSGYTSKREVIICRENHIRRVKELILSMDVLIFTLGLTEAWFLKSGGTVVPTAPGVIASPESQSEYVFKNLGFNEVYNQFEEVIELVDKIRGNVSKQVKYILTVSPDPLTATASGLHVLSANAYSKAILRSVAGELARNHKRVDYFPSFEIITNPVSRGVFYDSNLRTVRQEGVNSVMKVFFKQHNPLQLFNRAEEGFNPSSLPDVSRDEIAVACEEALLEGCAK